MKPHRSQFIEPLERKPGQDPAWRVTIRENNKDLFSSAWYAIRIPNSVAAKQLLNLTILGLDQGLDLKIGSQFSWEGDGLSDFQSHINGHLTHVEHLQGPHNGGVWFFSVTGVEENYTFVPKNLRAAKWLCELIALTASGQSN